MTWAFQPLLPGAAALGEAPTVDAKVSWVQFEIPASGGAVAKTASASVGAAIQEPRSANASVSAAIRTSNTSTASLAAAIAARNTATASVSTAIRASVTAAA